MGGEDGCEGWVEPICVKNYSSLRRVCLLNRRRLSVAFIAIQIEYRKAYVAISFSVSSGKSFEVGDVTD